MDMLQKLQNSLTRIYQNGTSIPSTLHEQIKEQLSTSSGQEGLVSKFNVCEFDGLDNPLSVDRNAQLFAGDGVVYVPAQENDPSCTGDLCNVKKICESLLDGPETYFNN